MRSYVATTSLTYGRYRARGPRAMESMVEENGSAVDPLAQGSQSGETAPTIVTSVQSFNRNQQQQAHQLIASTSIVQLTLPSSAATQVYRMTSCVSMHFIHSYVFSFVSSLLRHSVFYNYCANSNFTFFGQACVNNSIPDGTSKQS